MGNVLIINGTHSDNSRVYSVQQHIEKYFDDAKSIKVYDLPAEALISADYQNETIKAANKLIEEAAGIIILTPVYKASYSGILKTFLDLIPQKGLENKIILPVAVGGSPYHMLATDYALKPVLSALGATTILQSVYIIDKFIEQTDDGFIIQKEEQKRLELQLLKLKSKVALPA